MKLMKKVLVLALAAATILMAACDNGNGGGTGGGNDGGNSGFVLPTLPESKGDDPFTGLETLTTANSSLRYLVDTTKKVLTEESSKDSGTTWSKSAEYSYSYDGTANPPTVTGRIEAQYEEGKRLTPADSLAAGEAEVKAMVTEGFGEMFDRLSGLDAVTQEAMLKELNTEYSLTLTVADLDPNKKNATLEKVLNSNVIQDMLNKEREALKKMLSMTPTYAVTLTEKSGTTAKLAVEGQYDSTLQWYEQQAGSFYGVSSDHAIYAQFNNGFGSIYIDSSGTSYSSSAFTADNISFVGTDGTNKTFSYKTTGSSKDTVVTITVDSQNIECKWQPSPTIGR